MEYLQPEEAQNLAGLRLALTKDVPAPYSMSARAIFDHHKVAFTPVVQVGGGSNRALKAWTQHRNAPVAVLDDEAPRAGWLEILNLAERLGTGPSLVPDDLEQRMLMLGLTNELIGENGWIWQLRLIMLGLGGPERAAQEAQRNPMYQDYGYSEAAKTQALEKADVILKRASAQLKTQYENSAGQAAFFVGDRLSALDIYWVFFSQLIAPFPEEICAMPSYLRKSYDHISHTLEDVEPCLFEHRETVLRDHLTVPFTF